MEIITIYKNVYKMMANTNNKKDGNKLMHAFSQNIFKEKGSLIITANTSS